MALIKCAECGKEISDQATSCPSCGSPVKGKITTIEATGKKWKGMQLICALASIVGIIILIISATQGSTGGAVFGSLLFVGGIVGYVIAKIMAWWHHG